MNSKSKKLPTLLLCIILISIGILGMYKGFDHYYKKIYFIEYSEYVETYSEQYNMDKYFIYSIIKTESDFNKDAVSKDGARGLMQLMPETYDWVKSKNIDKKDHTFDEMFSPNINIMYGTYLISSLYGEFKSLETSLAAYHAGRGITNKWLKNPEFSSDEKTLHTIPYPDTAHYVKKVMQTYDKYKKLYDK